MNDECDLLRVGHSFEIRHSDFVIFLVHDALVEFLGLKFLDVLVGLFLALYRLFPE